MSSFMGNVRSILRACRRFKMSDTMSIFKLNEDTEMTDANEIDYAEIEMTIFPTQDFDITDPTDSDDDDPMDRSSPNILVIPSLAVVQCAITEDIAMESDVETLTKDIPAVISSYLCSKCGFQGRTLQEANGHGDSCPYDWSLPYLCDRCGRVYVSLVQALSHRQFHEEMNDGYLCSVCGETCLEWNVVGDYRHECERARDPHVGNESPPERSRKRKVDSYSEVDAKKMKLNETRADDIDESHDAQYSLTDSQAEDELSNVPRLTVQSVEIQTEDELSNVPRLTVQSVEIQTEDELSNVPQLTVQSVEIQTDDKQTQEMAIQTLENKTECKEVQTDRTTSLSLKNRERKTTANDAPSPMEGNRNVVNSESFSELFYLTFNRVLHEAQQYFNKNCSATSDNSRDLMLATEHSFYRSDFPTATPVENSGRLIESHRAVLDRIAPTQPQFKREDTSTPARGSPVDCKMELIEKAAVKKPRGRPRKNSLTPSVDDHQFTTPSSSTTRSKSLRSASKSRAKNPAASDFATVQNTPKNTKSSRSSKQNPRNVSTELIDASVFQAKKLLLPETFCDSSDDDSLPEVSFS